MRSTKTDLNAVERATRQTIADLGGIDILVNNAGIAGPAMPLWEFDPIKFREIIEINLLGVFPLLPGHRTDDAQ